MEIIQSFLEKHPCYVFNSDPKGDQRYLSFQEEGPKGIMIKSIYCPSAQDYINDLNKSFYSSCAHCLIKNGKAYQLLPWNFRGWLQPGRYNDSHLLIQIGVPVSQWDYALLIEICSFLVDSYQIEPSESNFIVELSEEGYSKDGFIKELQNRVASQQKASQEESEEQETSSLFSPYMVRVKVASLNYRDGPGIHHKIIGSIKDKSTYCIVEKAEDWGKIEGLGWIHLMHTEKI